MRRHFVRFCRAASAFLLVALLLASIISGRYLVWANWQARSCKSNWSARIVFGFLVFTHLRLDPPEEQLPPSESGWRVRITHVNDEDSAMFSSQADRFRFAGVAYYALHSFGLSQYDLMVPIWIPAFSLAVAPSVAIYRCIRRRRRHAAGRCLTCGYDLRGSEGVCPECGTPIARGIRASPDASRETHPSAPG